MSVQSHDVAFVAFAALKTVLNELARQSPEDQSVVRERMKAEIEQTLAAFVDKERGGTPLMSDGAAFLIAALFSDGPADARN